MAESSSDQIAIVGIILESSGLGTVRDPPADASLAAGGSAVVDPFISESVLGASSCELSAADDCPIEKGFAGAVVATGEGSICRAVVMVAPVWICSSLTSTSHHEDKS